jgi:type VI protein secretion system component Hcp
MMKAITFSLLMALVALSFVRPAHPTSMTMYISFKGSKQGQLKGETKGKGGREKEGWFQIQSIDLAHKPVVITKETDGSSPQLLQAHYTHECRHFRPEEEWHD